MANTIVKTSLPDYVATNNEELLVKAMLGAKTLDYVEIMTNVKYKSALNYLDSTVVFGDGSECGFAAQGTDTLSQRTIEVKPIKINKEWCDRDLISTYSNHQLLIAAGRETMPWEERFTQANLDAIKAELEKTIWQGNDSLGIQGFIDLAGSETGVIDVTADEPTAVIDAAYNALPEETLAKGDVVIFTSPAIFRAYVQAQNSTCCSNTGVIDAAAGELNYVGDSRVKIVAVNGLNGQNVAIASHRTNFVYATDVEGSENIFKLWYSDDADMFRFKVLFNAGVQFKFPSEVVYVTVA